MQRPSITRALRILREVEARPLYEILLAAPDTTEHAAVVDRIIQMAECFRQFILEEKALEPEGKQEAYAILKAAYAGEYFPKRHCLERRHFERLLDLHLEHLG